MASLLNFVTSSVAALRDTVVNVIAPETPPMIVHQQSSKRPPTKGGARQKKKVGRKPKKMTNKGAPEEKRDEGESASDSGDEEQPTAPTMGEQDTSELYQQDASQEEGPEEREGDVSSNDAETEAREAAASEQRREQRRKKNVQRRAKEKARKEREAHSIVNRLPDDPLENERSRILQDLSQTLQTLAPLDLSTSSSEINMQVPDLERRLQELIRSAEAKQKELTRKLPRCSPDSRDMDIPAIKEEIIKLEFAPDHEDLKIARKLEDLQAQISWQKHRVFQEKINELKVEAENRLEANRILLRKAHEREARERAAYRLNNTIEGDKVSPDQLQSRKMDITSAMYSALFQPHNLNRKVEKKFEVVIEGSGARVGNQRSITIWGVGDRPAEAFSFIQAAAEQGLQKKVYERRFFSTLIGRGGGNLAKIEQDCDAVVSVEGDAEAEVFVYGTRQGIADAFEEVQGLVTANSPSSNQNETRVTTDITIDGLVARALSSLHRARVHKLESESNAQVRVMANPADGRPRIVLQCAPDRMEALRAKVKSDILDQFCILKFTGPARAISRLMFPPRQANQMSQNRLLHDEFRALRDSLSLFVDRVQHENSDADTPVDMYIICHQVDRENVQQRATELVEKASYMTSRVPIEREQLRIFTPENRALIEASSQCRLGVVSGGGGPGGAGTSDQPALILTGNDAAVEKAKEVVAEVLGREGKVVKYTFPESEVIGQLFRNSAARLRDFEGQYGVSITIPRDSGMATLVGGPIGIDQCIAAFDSMANEIKERRENTETLIITLDSHRIPQLIGRGGAQIREIREESRVDDINIPRRDQQSEDRTTTDVTITGSKEAVARAQVMIEQALNLGQGREQDHSESPTSRSAPRGRGRGRQAAQERAPRRLPQPNRHFSSGQLGDDNDFPTIASSITGMAASSQPVVVQSTSIASPPPEQLAGEDTETGEKETDNDGSVADLPGL